MRPTPDSVVQIPADFVPVISFVGFVRVTGLTEHIPWIHVAKTPALVAPRS